MADTKAASMNFMNALERIPKLVEQYKAQNVTYERDILILQQTVGGVWKKEDELKQLKSEVAALERKIQLELAPPKPEAAQEPSDGETVRIQSQPIPERTTTEPSADAMNQSPFLREHVILARPAPAENRENRGIKM